MLTSAAQFTWAGEALLEAVPVQAPLLSTAQFTWAGEAVLEAANAVLTAEASFASTALFTWAGEAEQEYSEEELTVSVGNIGNGAISITAALGSIIVPFNPDSSTENIVPRGTVTPTFDGVGFYNGGYYDVDREFNLVISSPTREQVETMKNIAKSVTATVIHWDGAFTVFVQKVEVAGDELRATLKVIK